MITLIAVENVQIDVHQEHMRMQILDIGFAEAELMVTAPPGLDNLWTRLRCVFGTNEQCFPTGGVPRVTAIVGLWLRGSVSVPGTRRARAGHLF